MSELNSNVIKDQAKKLTKHLKEAGVDVSLGQVRNALTAMLEGVNWKALAEKPDEDQTPEKAKRTIKALCNEVEGLADLISDAHDTHIWDDEDCEDCHYCQSERHARSVAASAKKGFVLDGVDGGEQAVEPGKVRLAVVVDGGLVHEILTDGHHNIEALIVDTDSNGSVELDRLTKLVGGGEAWIYPTEINSSEECAEYFEAYELGDRDQVTVIRESIEALKAQNEALNDPEMAAQIKGMERGLRILETPFLHAACPDCDTEDATYEDGSLLCTACEVMFDAASVKQGLVQLVASRFATWSDGHEGEPDGFIDVAEHLLYVRSYSALEDVLGWMTRNRNNCSVGTTIHRFIRDGIEQA